MFEFQGRVHCILRHLLNILGYICNYGMSGFGLNTPCSANYNSFTLYGRGVGPSLLDRGKIDLTYPSPSPGPSTFVASLALALILRT